MNKYQIEEMERWDIAKILSQNFYINGEGWDDSDFEWAAHILQMEGYHKSKWISVEHRLPERSGKYLVCTKNGNVYQTKFYSYPENLGGRWGQKDKGRSITHWMPLPDAPKGGVEE